MLKYKAQAGTLIAWTAVLLWMLVIFSFSSQAADQSADLSKGIVEIFIDMIEKIVPGYDVAMINLEHYIRKSAHFCSYLILGILVMNALRRSGVEGFRLCAFALGICVLYAISDEVHQLFVSGRSGQATDVLLDSAGAMLGIGVRMLFKREKQYKL